MVRKLNPDELHRIEADNGFVAGAHREEDEIQQSRDPFTERYLKNQQESLELWTVLVIDIDNAQEYHSLTFLTQFHGRQN